METLARSRRRARSSTRCRARSDSCRRWARCTTGTSSSSASARRGRASVAASIFVNPLQFGPNEDLATYPRDEAGDRAKLAAAGVDVLFAPEAAAMYAAGLHDATSTSGRSATIFEGALRPQPLSRRHDGDREAAQHRAARRALPRAEGRAAGRDPAQDDRRSQRSGRASRSCRRCASPTAWRCRAATAISTPARRAAGADAVSRAAGGARRARARRVARRDAIAAGAAALSPAAKLDYLELVDAGTFAPLERLRSPAFIIGAARFGTTRLIDNLC